MPSFAALLAIALGLLAAGASLAVILALRRARASSAVTALGTGHFAKVLETAETGRGAGRDDLWAAAVAAKHLLRLDEARGLIDRVLGADPGDGEARLESGLIAAYAGDLAAAERELLAAASLRSDLAESITLHRAWLALRRDPPDLRTARRLFDEVESPLETKLRSDLGGGEPLFAEWFLHAAALWAAFGDPERAAWAAAAGRSSAPESRLPEVVLPAALSDPSALPLQ